MSKLAEVKGKRKFFSATFKKYDTKRVKGGYHKKVLCLINIRNEAGEKIKQEQKFDLGKHFKLLGNLDYGDTVQFWARVVPKERKRKSYEPRRTFASLDKIDDYLGYRLMYPTFVAPSCDIVESVSYTNPYDNLLKISVDGDNSTIFITDSGLKVACGYNRIIITKKGPYIEFDYSHLCWDNIIKPETHGRGFSLWGKDFEEYRSKDSSNVLIYKSKRLVSYGSYRPDLFYISPYKINTDEINPIIASKS